MHEVRPEAPSPSADLRTHERRIRERRMIPQEPELALLFEPLHKRALGLGVGFAAALVMFLVTAVPLATGTADALPLYLVAQYFNGYSVTWTGALVGAAWAGFVGFVAGWFVAFCRNAVLGVRLVVLRARAEYLQTRDFLDHI
ncbi:MAG: hypothetical protein H0W15_05060 [Gemmatimonadales bacterium]|nr:hypothetical protein [Gemmatimonadales bacterium]